MCEQQMPFEFFVDEDGKFYVKDTKTGDIFYLKDEEDYSSGEEYEPTYPSFGGEEEPEYKLFPEKEESYYEKFWKMIKIW